MSESIQYTEHCVKNKIIHSVPFVGCVTPVLVALLAGGVFPSLLSLFAGGVFGALVALLADVVLVVFVAAVAGGTLGDLAVLARGGVIGAAGFLSPFRRSASLTGFISSLCSSFSFLCFPSLPFLSVTMKEIVLS